MEYRVLSFLFLPLIVNCNENGDDYYTSPVGIQKLFKVEQKLLSAALDYANELESRINKVKSYLEDYEESILPVMTTRPGRKLQAEANRETHDEQNNEEDAPSTIRIYSQDAELEELEKKVSSHPLISYRLIRRFALELKDIEEDILLDKEKKFLLEIEKARQSITFPNSKDISGAIEGIIRIQDAYNADITQFTQGNFSGHETNSSLRAVDCYQIGVYALQASIFTRAIEWLEMAFHMVRELNDSSIPLNKVEQAYVQSIEMHNRILPENPSNPYVFKTPFVKANSSEDSRSRGKLIRSLEDYGHQLYHDTETMTDLWNFAALCDGEMLQSLHKMKELTCFYQPWTMLPIIAEKVELLHKEPPVYQIHNVLSDAEIERLLERAAPFMSRAKVAGSNEKESFVPSSIRTSTTHWIIEKGDPVLAKIPYRIQMITGLQVMGEDAAEDLQVSSYGIGGHYNPHFDTLLDTKPRNLFTEHENLVGDRIATFMFYLSTIQRGGGTAFPRLGVVAQPVKGSAVYWHNLKSDGSKHPFSLHGGCPVMYGTKHVANKWIRANSQMFSHKCNAAAA